jgi:hypothetical protein
MKLKRNKLKTIKGPKTKKKHIIPLGKLVELVDRVSRASTSNLLTQLWTSLELYKKINLFFI